MQLTVSDVYCYDRLELQFKPGLTLVTGTNAAGKSSVARILGALTSGHTNPSHLSGGQRQAYVRDGSGDGIAQLDGIEWRPKTGELTFAEGTDYPLACPEAVGLTDFTAKAHGPKQRAAMWEELFLPEDPRVLLEPAWQKAGRPVASLDAILKEIAKSGWKGALATYIEKQRNEKRTWETLAGTRWGGKKSSSWTPHGWDSTLEDESHDSLQAQLVNAKDTLAAMVVKSGVEQAAIDRARKIRSESYTPLAQRLPLLESKMRVARDKSNRAQASRDENERDIEAKRAEISRAERALLEAETKLASTPPWTCPHCNGALTQGKPGRSPEKWAPPSREEEARLQDVVKRGNAYMAEAKKWLGSMLGDDGLRAKLTLELSDALQEEQEVEREIIEVQSGLKALEPEIKLADAEASDAVGSEVDRQHAENVVEDARNRLVLWKTWSEATRAHENIIEYEYITKLLGPDGVRTQLLDREIGTVNKLLANITGVAKWPKIELTPSYDVTVGGRPMQLTAASEQLRAQWAFQIVFARRRKSTWLILDQGDTLAGDAWVGLERLLGALAAKRPNMFIVLCATERPPLSSIPDTEYIRIDRIKNG